MRAGPMETFITVTTTACPSADGDFCHKATLH
ncbi:hypothetical protein J2W42_005585 [Rhizobium tibeticum]|uniref:Uncharacterized protein n=1 Tax=Rhizobium tibeticum TaxID=501024 RepID=A0A1H8K6B1_9HYPH|nr:hypothetical protein [Rhizobium tibeticum]SEH77040.1 hypothetical protein RTCCBAU85039_2245 [Rhizobium tibeticum]SEN88550.1 hypothetical protein SAMN05216228_1008214 [Rhizobium tibeticum]